MFCWRFTVADGVAVIRLVLLLTHAAFTHSSSSRSSLPYFSPPAYTPLLPQLPPFFLRFLHESKVFAARAEHGTRHGIDEQAMEGAVFTGVYQQEL
jgi:hypothetical protein